MARSIRPAYDPLGPFVVRVVFRFAGVLLLPGMPFGEGIDGRRVRLLYDARKISLASENEKGPAQVSETDDWRELGEEPLLAYAFEKTGTQFRKADRAIKALEDLD